MSARTSGYHGANGEMRPTVGIRQIDVANTAFLARHKILWRSQLFGHRVCDAYEAIQDFMTRGSQEDLESRLFTYADLLLTEMVRSNRLRFDLDLMLETAAL